MSGLAHYLENEGLSTVCIALVREHAVAMAPPRALWVPYPLGRPFGAPNNPDLQRKIILSAFELLTAPSGPVLVDLPDQSVIVEERAEAAEPWVCPVSFPAKASDPNDPMTPLLAEIQALEPWYYHALEQRKRTLVTGFAGSPEEAARFLVAQLGDEGLTLTGPASDLVDKIRWASDDLKTFCYEAASAQADSSVLNAIEQWFWHETTAAKVLQALRQKCLAHENPEIQDLGDFMLVPDEFRG